MPWNSSHTASRALLRAEGTAVLKTIYFFGCRNSLLEEYDPQNVWHARSENTHEVFLDYKFMLFAASTCLSFIREIV